MKQSVKKWIIAGMDAVYLLAVLILCIVSDDGGRSILYFTPLTSALIIYAFTGGIPLGISAFLWWAINSEDCCRWVKINGALGICGAVLNLLLLVSPFLLPDVNKVVLTVPCFIVLPALIVSWIATGIAGAVRKRKSEAAQTEK